MIEGGIYGGHRKRTRERRSKGERRLRAPPTGKRPKTPGQVTEEGKKSRAKPRKQLVSGKETKQPPSRVKEKKGEKGKMAISL
ncbi:hypothetical protein L484_021451 [Morus notabilis]|uniref:Uncharacterized protein n=1 Tax=Morus notabilis TaxID=981085 RepID=W9SE24_9ROSA|nr:hypothetical protein L484_021451 [Morus notabilis]